MRVSKSGFMAWRKRRPSLRDLVDARLKPLIRRIHEESLGVYGAPRVHVELREAHGVRVGRKRVARLMREMGTRASTGAVSGALAILTRAWPSSRTTCSASSGPRRLTSCGWLT